MGEVVENQIQGVFVEPKQPEKLAETLFKLLNDHDKLRDMSIAASQRVSEAYSIQQLSKSFSQVYRGLTN